MLTSEQATAGTPETGAPATGAAVSPAEAPPAADNRPFEEVQLELARKLLSNDAPAEKPAEDKPAAGAVRDPATGRFVKADGTAEDTPEGEEPADDEKAPEAADEAADGESDSPETEEGEQEPAETAPPRDPPAYLSPELKARWGKLDPDVQDAVAAHALENRQTISRLGNVFEPFRAVAVEYRDFFDQHKLAPADAFRNLMDWNVQITRDPAAAILGLAKAAQIDLAALAGASPQQQQPVDDLGLPPDPEVVGLKAELEQLKAIIQQHDSHLTAQQREQRRLDAERAERTEREQQAQVEAVADAIARLEVELPDFKKLLNSGDIGIEVEKVRAKSPNLPHEQVLRQAYDRALWANEGTRGRALQQQQAAERKAREEKAAAAAAKAKKAAATTVRGAPPKTAPAASVADAQAETVRKFQSMGILKG
ncbi:MAG: hypothetical protein RLZ98_3522 [Pseudomonadota bacterium]|jgi:hypothetical protein